MSNFLKNLEDDAVKVTTLVSAHMYISIFTIGFIVGLFVKWAL